MGRKEKISNHPSSHPHSLFLNQQNYERERERERESKMHDIKHTDSASTDD